VDGIYHQRIAVTIIASQLMLTIQLSGTVFPKQQTVFALLETCVSDYWAGNLNGVTVVID
jgi:hypothetical protein